MASFAREADHNPTLPDIAGHMHAEVQRRLCTESAHDRIVASLAASTCAAACREASQPAELPPPAAERVLSLLQQAKFASPDPGVSITANSKPHENHVLMTISEMTWINKMQQLLCWCCRQALLNRTAKCLCCTSARVASWRLCNASVSRPAQLRLLCGQMCCCQQSCWRHWKLCPRQVQFVVSFVVSSSMDTLATTDRTSVQPTRSLCLRAGSVSAAKEALRATLTHLIGTETVLSISVSGMDICPLPGFIICMPVAVVWATGVTTMAVL